MKGVDSAGPAVPAEHVPASPVPALSTFEARRQLARLLLAVGRSWVAVLIAVTFAAATLPAALSLATGSVVGAASRLVEGDGAGAELGLSVGWFAAVLVLMSVLASLSGAITHVIQRRVEQRVRERVGEAALRPVAVQAVEEPAFLDGCRATVDGFPIGVAATSLISLAGHYAAAGLAALVVARFSPLLAALMFIAGLLVRRLILHSCFAYIDVYNRQQPLTRRSGYLSSLGLRAPAAKEVRIFDLSEWAVRSYTQKMTEYLGPLWRQRRRSDVEMGVGFAFAALTYGAAFVFIARGAARGELDVAGLVTTVQAAFSVPVAVALSEATCLQWVNVGLAELQEVERKAGPPPRSGAATLAVDQPRREIRFDAVTFCYPGSDCRVLDGLDLRIAAGRSTAIVGVNGAGKTTLVKLLSGLYEPSAGRVVIDDEDLARLDIISWRRQLAVIFQDFVRYELPASDNVAMGAPGLLHDRDALAHAADRAGCLELIERLPHGWDTVLARGYQRGAELSGGQWQRIALARALAATEAGARVLVLDEPTASLDVRAEAQLFDRFVELTEGLTTILISHRFSTVRRADHICVLDGGRLVEQGTHSELLENRGRYAEMFNLQAARFVDPTGPDA